MSHRLPLDDIRFIAEFAAFCRGKGDEEYVASSLFGCALAQYGYVAAQQADLATLGVPLAASDAALYGDTGDGSGTFNQLADRLEALIADAPQLERVS